MPKPKETTLVDIEVDEVSIVGEAANNRTFAVVKSTEPAADQAADAGQASDQTANDSKAGAAEAVASDISKAVKALDGMEARIVERVMSELAKAREAAESVVITKANTALDESRVETQKARDRSAQLEVENAAVKVDLAKASTDLAKASASLVTAANELALAKADADRLQAEVAALKQQVETARIEKAALEKSVTRSQAASGEPAVNTQKSGWPTDMGNTRRPSRAGESV